MPDSPLAEVRDHLLFDKGLYARKRIPAGTEIATFDGRIYNDDDAAKPDYPADDIDNHAVQISELEWQDSLGFARMLNHCCTPNCGIKKLNTIVTMRDIEPDEELCWDYAMIEDGEWDMDCNCATKYCRGNVAGFGNLSEETKQRYQGWTSTWLVAKYNL